MNKVMIVGLALTMLGCTVSKRRIVKNTTLTAVARQNQNLAAKARRLRRLAAKYSRLWEHVQRRKAKSLFDRNNSFVAIDLKLIQRIARAATLGPRTSNDLTLQMSEIELTPTVGHIAFRAKLRAKRGTASDAQVSTAEIRGHLRFEFDDNKLIARLLPHDVIYDSSSALLLNSYGKMFLVSELQKHLPKLLLYVAVAPKIKTGETSRKFLLKVDHDLVIIIDQKVLIPFQIGVR